MSEPALIGDNQPATLQDRFAGDYGDILARRDELLAAAERVPEEITDDVVAGNVSDFIKMITTCTKNAESHRVKEKEPFLEGGRQVDGWFKAIIEPLETIKKDVQARYTQYLRNKEEVERRAREETERKAREDAAEAERLAAEKAASAETDADLDAAVEAEQKAVRTREELDEATDQVDANAAELSRTRGDLGSVGSLHTSWTGEVADRAVLDLESLRPHLSTDALEKAVRAFVRAGGRELNGARIYEKHQGVVR